MTEDPIGRAPPDPQLIFSLTTAYWSSQLLFAALDLGVFDFLHRRPSTAEEVASGLVLDLRVGALLLNACVAHGLLERDGSTYRNSAVAESYLAPSAPWYLGDAVRYGEDMFPAWAGLAGVARSGQPCVDAAAYLGDDPERTRHFVRGMHNRALGIGSALVRLVDLSGCRRLLDVGGGPGTYAALFAEANPDLHAMVLDLPHVVALAREILADFPAAEERVEVLAGDYHRTPFPPGNDAVLLSGVLHREDADACRALLHRAGDSLARGGVLVVCDVFADAGGCSPRFATLFGLNMALSAPHGCVHQDVVMADWMRGAGFVDLQQFPLPDPMPHRVLVGRKG